MVTVTLGRTYTWRNSANEPEQFYGPGTVDVPDELAVILRRIGAVLDEPKKGRKSAEVEHGTQPDS